MQHDLRNDADDGYQWQDAEGFFRLSPTLCTSHRCEFFRRSMEIDLFHQLALTYIEVGERSIHAAAERHQLGVGSPVRLRAPGTSILAMNYGRLQDPMVSGWTRAELTNQAFVMTYTNFEVYVSELVIAAFEQSVSQDPDRDARDMMQGAWRGRFDRMNQKFNLRFGKRTFTRAFRGIEMGFFDRVYDDPREYLEEIALVRNMLIHRRGRVSEEFCSRHPTCRVTPGQRIGMPSPVVGQLNLLCIRMTGVIDEAFATAFGWQRTLENPEELGAHPFDGPNAPDH